MKYKLFIFMIFIINNIQLLGMSKSPDNIIVTPCISKLACSNDHLEYLNKCNYGNDKSKDSEEVFDIIIIKIPKYYINSLSREISCSKFISYLNLSLMTIRKIPEEILSLSNLESLDLSNNLLDNLPESFGDLSCLRNLYLNNNDFKEIPECIGLLCFLCCLDLSTNCIVTVPNSLVNLKGLITLNLSYNKIREFPFVLCELEFLRDLNLKANNLSKLNDKMGSFRLSTLWISLNHLLEDFTPTIKSMPSINIVYISQDLALKFEKQISELLNIKSVSILSDS